MLDLGINRIILGSAIVSDPAAAETIAGAFPGKVAAGLDARDGRLATNGWLSQSGMLATDAARRLIDSGLKPDLHRYPARRHDVGPNLIALGEMIAIDGAEVVASGGIGSIDDFRAVAEAGAAGIIIGRALYDGRVRLADALTWQK